MDQAVVDFEACYQSRQESRLGYLLGIRVQRCDSGGHERGAGVPHALPIVFHPVIMIECIDNECIGKRSCGEAEAIRFPKHVGAALSTHYPGEPSCLLTKVAALETNRYSLAVNLVKQGQGVTIVDEFALVGVERTNLVAIPFEPSLQIAVVAFNAESGSISQPVELCTQSLRKVLTAG
ncbi:transcriptional regulator [Pseudomonas monteilii]|uniref:Transcriptional regulator n=1 Tax=Pseudomonas monteilii TaxID=76759 RepID=A0AAE6V240_9PSED|nr:transcriptional regulator [Pseudomonas monteilii]